MKKQFCEECKKFKSNTFQVKNEDKFYCFKCLMRRDGLIKHNDKDYIEVMCGKEYTKRIILSFEK